MANKTTARQLDAGDITFSPLEQRLMRRYDHLDAETTCEAERDSYANPDHRHVCTAPAGHRYDDGHVCPCGDWWHD